MTAAHRSAESRVLVLQFRGVGWGSQQTAAAAVAAALNGSSTDLEVKGSEVRALSKETCWTPALEEAPPHDRKKGREVQPRTRSFLYSSHCRSFRVKVSRACFSAINGRRQFLPIPREDPRGRFDQPASLPPSLSLYSAVLPAVQTLPDSRVRPHGELGQQSSDRSSERHLSRAAATFPCRGPEGGV